jgi:ferrous iron transport protein A
MFRRFRNFPRFWHRRAHGEKIGYLRKRFDEKKVSFPSLDSVISLSRLPPGEEALIVDLGMGRGFINRLTPLGFTLGTEVKVAQNFGRGPLLVVVRDTTVALGRREAHRILVRRK